MLQVPCFERFYLKRGANEHLLRRICSLLSVHLLSAAFLSAAHSLNHRINVHLLSAPARCQAVQAENVTVLEGGTAEISCRLQNYDGSIVVIQNPRRQTLFFNGTRGVCARRSLQADLIHRCPGFHFEASPLKHISNDSPTLALYIFLIANVLALPLKRFHIKKSDNPGVNLDDGSPRDSVTALALLKAYSSKLSP